MVSVIHQPHDKYFKQAMSDLNVAREFFETHLPSHILSIMDLKTLELQKETFVDQAYKTTEADIIYSVKIGERIGYLYLLCEHQSDVDRWISLRLDGYLLRFLESHQKKNPQKPLPIVYPLVVYTGKRIWNAPMEIYPLFGENEKLAREIFLNPYQLIDVYRINDADLRKHQWSGLVEFVLKYRRGQDFRDAMKHTLLWIRDIDETGQGRNLAKMTLIYMLRDMETVEKQSTFVKIAEKYLSPELQEGVMTFAQQWLQEGRQEGRQEGIQEGKEEATIEIAQKMLSTGMPLEQIAKLSGLPIERIAKLQ